MGQGSLELSAGAWRMTLYPEAGGVIARLDHEGTPVLRPMAEDWHDPVDAACFPLVPYANRIAGGCFTVHGRTHRLPLNFGDHPHSLHGLGWQSSWEVASASASEAVLVHRHDGGAGWPWRYRAVQKFALGEQGLEAELTLVNEDDEIMPCGLGFHPYFAIDAATRLRFAAARVWLTGGTLLPARAEAVDRFGDWASGALASGAVPIDNAYEDWTGTAEIERGDGRSYRLSAQESPWLHLYRPANANFFCAEPVSHGPDAINRGGMPMLPPASEQSLTMAIAITPTLSRSRSETRAC